LERCLNTDAAVSSLLALAGGELQPQASETVDAALQLLAAVNGCGRTRRFCAPAVLDGAAVTLLVALLAAAQQPDAGGISATSDERAAELLVRMLHAQGAPVRAALALCQRTALRAAFRALVVCGGNAKRGAAALVNVLAYNANADADSWVHDELCGALLAPLTELCARHAPEELAAWQRLDGGAAMAMQEQGHCMQTVVMLSRLSTNADSAALIAGLLARAPGVRAKAQELQLHVLNAAHRTVLRDATALSATALRDVQAAHDTAQRRASRLGEADAQAEDVSVSAEEVAARRAARPLLAASRRPAATLARRRIALRRANVVHCHEALLRRRLAASLEAWMHVAAAGYAHTCVVGGSDAESAHVVYAYTTGLFYTLSAPELVVLADAPGLPAALAQQLCAAAGDAVVLAAAATGDDAPAAALSRDGMRLRERDAGLVAWAYARLGAGAAVPPAVAAAADKVVWLLRPLRDVATRNADEHNKGAMEAVVGSATGRARRVFYTDVAAANAEALQRMPTLLCSMGASLRAAGAAGAAVLRALSGLEDRRAAPTRDGVGSAMCGAGEACSRVEQVFTLKLRTCARCKLSSPTAPKGVPEKQLAGAQAGVRAARPGLRGGRRCGGRGGVGLNLMPLPCHRSIDAQCSPRAITHT
jgi:hypothetical protein